MKDTLVQTNVRLRESQIALLDKKANLLKRRAKAGKKKAGFKDEIVRESLDAYLPTIK